MREKNLNFDKQKIFKFFQDKKYLKISKISKSILKAFANDKEIYKIIIYSEINEKNIDKALVVSEKLLLLKDDAETNYIHGNVLKLKNKFEEAIIFYKKAIELKHDFFEAYNNLASSQKKIGLINEAIQNYNTSIKIKENNLEAHFNLGNLLYEEKNFDEALTSYEKVIEINREFPKSYFLIAQIKSVQGKFEEAKTFFLKAIEKDKFLSEAYVHYVNTRKIKEDDTIIKVLEELLKIEDLDNKLIQNFCYALSKIYFDIDKIEPGFKLLKKAKTAYTELNNYSITEEKNHFIKIKQYFLSNKFPKSDFDNAFKKNPIFIIGMPRSGTSLIEQIVSTHSKVYGAGELTILPKIIHNSIWDKNTNPQELLNFVREEYLSKISKLNTNKEFIIDKMPFNFFYVGFILNSIPEAKIIHMYRNPMAICWSNYKANFFDNIGMDYAHKLETIGEFYVIYNETMKFWNEIYPNSLIEVDYDNFVMDFVLGSKSIIEEIGLNWEDKILNFHENNRAVETNSLLQVRNQVYQNSSKNWKKYEKYLTPVMEILNKNNIKF